MSGCSFPCNEPPLKRSIGDFNNRRFQNPGIVTNGPFPQIWLCLFSKVQNYLKTVLKLSNKKVKGNSKKIGNRCNSKIRFLSATYCSKLFFDHHLVKCCVGWQIDILRASLLLCSAAANLFQAALIKTSITQLHLVCTGVYFYIIYA